MSRLILRYATTAHGCTHIVTRYGPFIWSWQIPWHFTCCDAADPARWSRFVLFTGLAIILFFAYSTFFDSSRQVYHCDLDLDSIQADGSHTEWSHGPLVDAGLQPFAINPTPKHVVSGVLKAFPTLPIVEEPKKQDEVKKPEPKEKDKQKKKPELDVVSILCLSL